jgi:S1-C subfamily serine protease
VRWCWLRRVCVVAAAALSATACSDGDLLGAPATTTSTPADPVGPCRDAAAAGPLDATALLSCLGPSLAFIETPSATGSGILIDDGYVVTNAHVVDPFGSVRVSFDGGEVHDDVPVVGADLLTDIAVLGPIDTSRSPVPIDDPADLDNGSDVFLLGYPGEIDIDSPEPTISRGIISRRREAKPFGLEYIQTDAAIAGGQSGGALVDVSGRAVGVSGLTFAEEFALALGAVHVQDSIDAILAGSASEYHPLPTEGSVTSATFHVDDADVDEGFALLPTSDRDTTVRLSLRSDAVPTLDVFDILSGEEIFASRSLIEQVAEMSGVSPEEIDPGGDRGREVEPNVFEIDVPADVHVGVTFGTTSGPADVTLDAPDGVFVIVDGDDDQALAVGDVVEGTIDYLEQFDRFVIELAAGDEVSLFVGSPAGDMTLTVQSPAQSVFDADYFDDSSVGLLGLDVDELFTANESGTYVLYVSTADGLSTAYRLEVNAA